MASDNAAMFVDAKAAAIASAVRDVYSNTLIGFTLATVFVMAHLSVSGTNR